MDSPREIKEGLTTEKNGDRDGSKCWDYQKYLELDPDGPKAPQIRNIVERYDDWASGNRVLKSSDTDYKDEMLGIAAYLYEEAYVLKNSKPQEALRKLRLVLRLPAKYVQPYWDKAEHLIKRIESGPEEPPPQRPRPEEF